MSDFIVFTSDGRGTSFKEERGQSFAQFVRNLRKAQADPSKPWPRAVGEGLDGSRRLVHFNPAHVAAISTEETG
jgi:hypothetical protein